MHQPAINSSSPLHSLRQYSPHKFRRDLLAGLTVSVVEVPQAMAYALIAGVPPQCGIYTSVIQGTIGALVSSSEHLRVGPTNTQSLLVASAVARVAGATPAEYLQLVFALTLLKGLIQLAFAIAQMGNMVRYVSRSVTIGVAAGAGVLIAAGQLPHFFGLQLQRRDDLLPGVIGTVQSVSSHWREVNEHAVIIGATSLVIILVARAISKLIPGALMAMIAGMVILVALGWKDDVPLVPTFEPSLPAFTIANVGWRQAESLLGGALALALLGMIETVSITKTLASRTGERINANREFFAQGVTNFIGGFFQCIPGSGSFSRSALDYEAGAATRVAAVFNAVFIALIFWLLAEQARYIPMASLAAVLLVIAATLIDWRYLLRVARTDRSDAMVCVITFLATLIAPLEYAIFIGIFLNIGLYLRTASRLHMQEMVTTPGGPFMERALTDSSGHKQVMFLQVEGDLFFGVADELQDQLTNLSRSGVRVVILRLKRTHSLDSTVLHVLEEFARVQQKAGGHVILCGIKPELMQVLRAYGLINTIGKDNVFETGFGVFTSAKRALERAKKIVGHSIDTSEVDVEEEKLSYEI